MREFTCHLTQSIKLKTDTINNKEENKNQPNITTIDILVHF